MPLEPDVEQALVFAAVTYAGKEAPALLERLCEPARCLGQARALLAAPRGDRGRRLARLAADLFAVPAPCAEESPATPPEWRLWLRRRAGARVAPSRASAEP
ncbi:MAG: hypothetical protein AABZ30_12695, partial [Myxococcota bacterium]